MQITCTIIDDEPLACELLKGYVERTNFLVLKGIYNTASQAIRNITERPVDLVFMDIQMPDVNGIDLTRMLPLQTKVVFTTAFKEYAVNAFRVEALDYLTKPINYNEFLQAANKCLAYVEQRDGIPAALPASAQETAKQEQPQFFFIKTDYKSMRINVDDLLYIEGQKDYVHFHLRSQPNNPIQSLISMKSIQSNLPAPHFLRIHRSYIVNSTYIDSIERGEVVIAGERIPISEGYKSDLQDFVRQNSL